MSEFSRRVDVEVFKDEPKSRDEWRATATVTAGQLLDIDTSDAAAAIDKLYREYLASFQPYWWHAQSSNGEILTNGEHYAYEAGAINSIEVLFGDDTTMYWAPMYGEDRGDQLLRYGKTDREHQAAQASPAALGLVADGPYWHKPECHWVHVTTEQCDLKATHYYCPHPEHACNCGGPLMTLTENCQTPGCGKAIEPVPNGYRSPTGYRHTGSNRVCCFDVYKPDFATPPAEEVAL